MSGRYLQAISASFGLFSLGAAFAATTAPQVAAPAADASMRVLYSDLDLASANGVAALDARIREAAAPLCRSRDAGWLAQSRAERDCLRWALADTAVAVRGAATEPPGGPEERFVTVTVHR